MHLLSQDTDLSSRSANHILPILISPLPRSTTVFTRPHNVSHRHRHPHRDLSAYVFSLPTIVHSNVYSNITKTSILLLSVPI